MEFSSAGAELLGDAEAAGLRVLARLSESVSGREVARRAGVSPSSMRRALERLLQAGLVHSRVSSHAVLYEANRAHILWEPVLAILTAPNRLLTEIGHFVTTRAGEHATLAVFGSVARGTATATSDLDLLLVLPDTTPDTDREALVDDLTTLVETRSGNPAQIVTLTPAQLSTMTGAGDPLIDSLHRDARTLAGPPLTGLLTASAVAA